MKKLDVTGLDGHPVHCVQYLPELIPAEGVTGLAVILPGYAYPSDGPVLFYLKLLLVELGWEVITVDYHYNEDAAFLSLPEPEKDLFIEREQRHLAAKIIGPTISGCAAPDGAAVPATPRCRKYLFAGKSLGTTALTIWHDTPEVRKIADRAGFIWLTPAQAMPDIIRIVGTGKSPSLFVAGEKDPYFRDELIAPIRNSDSCRFLILPDAGHIFESSAGIEASVSNLGAVMGFIRKNLDAGFPRPAEPRV